MQYFDEIIIKGPKGGRSHPWIPLDPTLKKGLSELQYGLNGEKYVKCITLTVQTVLFLHSQAFVHIIKHTIDSRPTEKGLETRYCLANSHSGARHDHVI